METSKIIYIFFDKWQLTTKAQMIAKHQPAPARSYSWANISDCARQNFKRENLSKGRTSSSSGSTKWKCSDWWEKNQAKVSMRPPRKSRVWRKNYSSSRTWTALWHGSTISRTKLSNGQSRNSMRLRPYSWSARPSRWKLKQEAMLINKLCPRLQIKSNKSAWSAFRSEILFKKWP